MGCLVAKSYSVAWLWSALNELQRSPWMCVGKFEVCQASHGAGALGNLIYTLVSNQQWPGYRIRAEAAAAKDDISFSNAVDRAKFRSSSAYFEHGVSALDSPEHG
jgi:hypothetical protein